MAAEIAQPLDGERPGAGIGRIALALDRPEPERLFLRVGAGRRSKDTAPAPIFAAVSRTRWP